MFFINGIITGILATFLFDLFQYSLSYSYDLNKPKWNLFGRYILNIKFKKYFQEQIENEIPLKNEFLIGYLFHHLVGSIFGIIYVFLNLFISVNPSLLLALIIGFLTVLGAWCLTMPYIFNIGFFASKKENKLKIITQNLIAHFIFGIGLFIGYKIIL